jgi:type IV pilus assembly protein PilP
VEEKPRLEYTYNPVGRRDPFAPIIVKEEEKSKLGDRPPLERYNLYDFKMTGVIWGGFGYNAMLEGPDGKGYMVRVGTVIGTNKGVVKKITQSSIVVEEKFKSLSGKPERKEIVIELRKKQEGTP